MKSIHPYFLLFWLALALSACQTDLTIPFPEHESRLTINSFLVEDGEFFLYVTRSFGALENTDPNDNGDLLVPDAEVSLWRDGEKLADFAFVDSVLDTALFELQPGVFDTSIYRIPAEVFRPTVALAAPQVGETYEYRAFHPDYGEASAEVTVVAPPQIVDARLKRDSLISATVDGFQERWSVIEITIDDPADLANYYSLTYDMTYLSIFDDGSGFRFEDTIRQRSRLATELVQSGIGGSFGVANTLPDTDFNGQRHVLLGWLLLPGCCGQINDQNPEEQELLSLSVEVFSLDANFGDYQEKLQLQSESRTSGLEGAILPREPVSVVGNVTGGYGLVGSFNAARVDVVE